VADLEWGDATEPSRERRFPVQGIDRRSADVKKIRRATSRGRSQMSSSESDGGAGNAQVRMYPCGLIRLIQEEYTCSWRRLRILQQRVCLQPTSLFVTLKKLGAVIRVGARRGYVEISFNQLVDHSRSL